MTTNEQSSLLCMLLLFMNKFKIVESDVIKMDTKNTTLSEHFQNAIEKL